MENNQVSEKTRNNNLRKPKSEMFMLFIPAFIMLIGIAVSVIGFMQEERNMGLFVSGLIIAGLMALLSFAIFMQNVSNVKKFNMLNVTNNIHRVEVLEIKAMRSTVKSKSVIVGYYTVCKFENKELYSETYKKEKYDIKVGDILNLYLPESGLKHNALLKVCYDYYIDIDNIVSSKNY